MREIIFRGKRIDNGEWVEGCLFVDDKGEKHEILVGYVNYRIAWEVNPETVRQYTGLTDKNGKKIFEGDIVKFGDILFYIIFVGGCFRLCRNHQYSYTLHNLYDALEIIGNIHDNPELLKGGVEE